TNFTNHTTGSRSQTINMHNITGLIRWQPNATTQITYHPAFSYSDNRSNGFNTVNSFNNFIPEIARSTNTDNNSGNNLQFEQTVEYNHQLKKEGESLSISHTFQVNPGNSSAYSINDLTSYTTGLSSYLLNRNTNSVNRSISGDIGINYRYPLSKKIAIGVGVTGDYNHQVNNTLTYDIDPSTGQYDIFLQNVSSNLTRNLSTENINPSVTYNFNQGMQLVLSANTRVQQVNNRFDRNLPDIDQHFATFLPSANLNLGNISIGYQSDLTLPNIGDMIPYSVVFSPLFSVTGNPYLKPTKRNSFNLGYNTYKSESQISIGTNANASFEQNSIFRQTTINSVGAETSTPINMNGRNLISLDGHLNKRFKKHNNLEFSTSTSLSATSSHGFFEVNHQDGYQTTYNAGLNQSFSVNWNDIVDIEQTYRFTNSVTKYSGINYNNQTYITHVADTHFNIFWPKRINIEGTYTYTYNPMVSPGFQKSSNLLNLSIAHALLKKDKGEIKLSCYDILNKNISSSRYVNANTITDMQSQVLKRYFLVTLLFKFNKSLSK
ncbi:MAG: outer membrane beta-barrel protein, partial [Mucilaginibacter sp.]